MTSENPDTQRELAEVPSQRIAGPVLFSVVLHGIVLLLFSRTVSSLSTEQSPAEERPTIRVVLAMHPPPITLEPASPKATESIPSEPAKVREPEPAEPDTVADAAPAEASTLREEDILSEASALREKEVSAEASPETGAAIQAWTPARVRAAIQASSGELRGTLTAEWMKTCILERKEHGTRECEQARQEQAYLSPSAAAGRAAGAGAFASVTRPDRHWLLEEQFRKDNDMLRALVDDEGIVGALASSRYYLNREYLAYLGGNRVDLVFGPMQNFPADVRGGPRLLLRGSIPFECGSKKLAADYGLDVGGVSFGKVPCIYEFTGFDIERPEADPDEFRVVPGVFGGGNLRSDGVQ